MSDTRIGMCKICPACCPIEVTIEQGRAVSIAGDCQTPSYGGYTCPKGRAMPDAHYGPQRLLHSQRRTAEGSFAPITSDAAIDEVAAKLRAIIDEHGPDSIGLLVGSGLAANPMNAAVSAAFMMALGTFDERFYSVMTIDQPGKVMARPCCRCKSGHRGKLMALQDRQQDKTVQLDKAKPLNCCCDRGKTHQQYKQSLEPFLKRYKKCH